jgi:hypothetical protein
MVPTFRRLRSGQALMITPVRVRADARARLRDGDRATLKARLDQIQETLALGCCGNGQGIGSKGTNPLGTPTLGAPVSGLPLSATPLAYARAADARPEIRTGTGERKVS